jgi:YHS domain-containing protein
MNRFIATRFAIAFILLVAVQALAQTSQPATKTYLNLDRHGWGLHGYDPVAYFTQNKAIKGDKNIAATYRGAMYRFASQEDKETFEKDPAKYEPQFGGFCGYAVSDNHTADVDPEAFVIQDGRLILQYSKSVLKKWQKEPAERLKNADKNWPGIADKNGN